MDKQVQVARKLPRILLLICVVAALFIALEMTAREMARRGIMGFTSEAGAIVPDSHSGWTLMPGFEGPMGGAEIRSSALGYRVGASTEENTEGAPLVVWLLGDSFVFGWGLEWADTLGAQLESVLPKGSRVYNLGVPGYGFGQSLMRMRTLGEKLPDPDAVFLLGNPLDFVDDLQEKALIFGRPSFQCALGLESACFFSEPGALHWLIWRHSTAYRNLRFFLEQRRATPSLSEQERQDLNKVVAAFSEASSSKGASFFPVLHIPERWARSSEGVSPDSLKAWSNITRNFRHLMGKEPRVQRDGIHWTPLGTKKVAMILRAMLGRKLEALKPPSECSAKSEAGGVWECRQNDGVWARSRKIQSPGIKFDLEQVYIPPGAGFMGPTELDLQSATASIKSVYGPKATRDFFMNETPAHVVYLDGFWIDRTEVTHKAFSWSNPPGSDTLAERRGYTVAYRGKGEFKQLEKTSWRNPGWLDTRVENMSRLPVTGITWGEAKKHCASLGLSLPTEAQWERAARGTDGRRYPWGQEKPSCTLANAGYAPYCARRPVAVGSHPEGQSLYGLQDVAGNVFEWVQDCRTDGYFWMPEGETWLGFPVNPTPPPAAYADDCASRMMRGGSWAFGYDAYLRAGARATEKGATMAEWGLGFRCGSDL